MCFKSRFLRLTDHSLLSGPSSLYFIQPLDKVSVPDRASSCVLQRAGEFLGSSCFLFCKNQLRSSFYFRRFSRLQSTFRRRRPRPSKRQATPRKGSEIGRAWERQAEGVGAGCLKKPPKRMHHPLNQVITTRGRTSRKSRSTQQAVTGQA